MLSSSTRKYLLPVLAVIAIIVIFALYRLYVTDESLRGIVSGNGRLEAVEVDIATKYAGRISKILVEEGDIVTQGEILALMDTDSLNAQIREAEANEIQALRQKSHALAILQQRRSECNLAKKNLKRSESLHERGIISDERMDEVTTQAESAISLCNAAEAQVENAIAAVNAASARIERLQVELEEATLLTPVNGRVQYRLAEPKEVLPAGGKVLTVIDLSDVYMNIFLSTVSAGEIPIGADSRILLDAFPDNPIPSKVTYVSPKAQFTPKQVETRSERQKLSFRVKVNVIKENESLYKPGMPGEAYIKFDDSVEWPQHLE